MKSNKKRHASAGKIGILLATLVTGFCVLAVYMTVLMHQQIYSTSTRASHNLLNAEVAGIDRILTIYDASLRSAAVTSQAAILHGVSLELRRLAIFDRVQDTPQLGPVRILNAIGAVLYDSSTAAPVAASPAELMALDLQSRSSSAAAMISPPFANGGAFAVTMSHRISLADGSFSGIVIGTINLDLFQRQFARINVGANDSVSLFSEAGTMLAHIPGKPLVGRSIAGSDLLRQFHSVNFGTVTAPAAIDGVTRVFSFSHIAPWSVFLDVGVSTEDLYRPWLFRTVITVCLIVTLITFMVLLLLLLKRDNEARLLTESNLVATERRYRMLAESSVDVIVRVDRQTVRTYVSPSVTQYGYEPEELVGLTAGSWVHEDDLQKTREAFFRTIDEQIDSVVHYRLLTKSGAYAEIEAHLSPIRQGGYLAVIRNVDNRVRAEPGQNKASHLSLDRLALVDDLTKLASRRGFDDALPVVWRDAVADGRPVSLVLVDVDHFRSYFERYGDHLGDDVLIEVAHHTDAAARVAGGVTSRYSDKTFAVILPHADFATATAMAQGIRTAVWHEAIHHSESPSGRVTVSVGVASLLAEAAYSSFGLLVRAAEEALITAKQDKHEASI